MLIQFSHQIGPPLLRRLLTLDAVAQETGKTVPQGAHLPPRPIGSPTQTKLDTAHIASGMMNRFIREEASGLARLDV